MITFQEMFPAEVVSVQNKPYLFSNARIDRNSVPKRFYAYDVRDDCDGEFWEVQNHVMVNHWATIVGLEEVTLDNDQYWCPPDPKDENLSSEGQFIGQTMESQADYVAWYGALKSYTQATN